jgi:GT2 family glycosyltransferase/glycosyltransferase involved in cell wall biosynthesis
MAGREAVSLVEQRDDSVDSDSVSVVVPIYAGLRETMACLASLARSGGGREYEVIIIDDASPDTQMSTAAAAFAERAGFVYRCNKTNLGFPATANIAFHLRPSNDIVLLNADTEVPPGWLTRLRGVALSDPKIATVTPLSNNATIMSLPRVGGARGLPYGLELEEIDTLCQFLYDGTVPDVPTAHGFCMYIRRAALSDVGGFDEDLFGRGYCEENDFSLRARAMGWRNVVAANVFVRHAGAVSFDILGETAEPGVDGGYSDRKMLLARNLAALNKRYPGYDAEIAIFIARDPLRFIRRRVQLHLWRQRGVMAVLVTNAMPGGTSQHVLSLSRRFAAEGRLVLWLQAGPRCCGEPGELLRLHELAPHGMETPPEGAVSDASGDAAELEYRGAAAVEEVLSDLAGLSPRFVHVHHLIDLPPAVVAFLRRGETPYVVTVHDYFFGCPRVTLLDEGGTFCGAPAAPLCRPCLATGSPHDALHPGWREMARDAVAWRAGWARFLGSARQIILPSQTAADMMTRLFPGLRGDIRPHPPAGGGTSRTGTHLSPPRRHSRRSADSHLRIAILGAIGIHKGVLRLGELVRHCHRHEPDLRFVVIGHTDRDTELARYANIEIVGPYAAEDVSEMIAASRCTVALFLSIWPETYCFTLSEALAAGLMPVALEVGAIAERLRARGEGTAILLPPHSPPDAIAAALRQANELRPRRPRGDRGRTIDAEYVDLLADYYEAVGADGTPAAVPIAQAAASVHAETVEIDGVFDDLWCGREFSVAVRVSGQVRAAALAVWTHSGHAGQTLTVRTGNGVTLTAVTRSGEVTELRLGGPEAPISLDYDAAAAFDPDGRAGLLRIQAAFEFVTPLGPPDVREGAAKLLHLTVEMEDASATHGCATVVALDDVALAAAVTRAN